MAANKIQAEKTGGVSNLTNAGKGRPKGALNKNTIAVKEAVLAALDKAGGVDYLVLQSIENPTAFLTLVGKVLPLQVTGGDGGPVALTILTGVPRANTDD